MARRDTPEYPVAKTESRPRMPACRLRRPCAGDAPRDAERPFRCPLRPRWIGGPWVHVDGPPVIDGPCVSVAETDPHRAVPDPPGRAMARPVWAATRPQGGRVGAIRALEDETSGELSVLLGQAAIPIGAAVRCTISGPMTPRGRRKRAVASPHPGQAVGQVRWPRRLSVPTPVVGQA